VIVQVFFWLLAGLAIIGALLCISQKNPVASALCLVLTLFALSGIYVLLDAHFIAVMQVVVYAGAIMVLFLFVIMLLNAGRPGGFTDLKGTAWKLTAAVLAGALIVQLLGLRRLVPGESVRLPAGVVERMTVERGAVGVIAEPLFRAYLVPFEITSLLLLAAVVGAVVLAKRRL
jgi:NADH-quinone oxidoreductase subunit J